MPDDTTIDFVVLFITLGLMALGTLSVVLGWVVRKYDEFVSRYGTVAEVDRRADEQTGQTDRADRLGLSDDDLYCPRLELDRTKAGAIEVLVYNGWSTGEIRSLVKGDNGAIGSEVDAARRRLGIAAPDNRTPIANRPTAARFAGER